MARFDRCNVCDYQESTGSSIAGVSPGSNGKVRRYNEDYLCDTCAAAVDRARFDLRPPQETDEELVVLEE